jgi:predicted DNA-binding transcriptional regulator AlpA
MDLPKAWRSSRRPELRPMTDRQAMHNSAANSLSVFITVNELANMARLSRRQIDRLRKRRLPNFPREYELGSGGSKFRSCPRFKLSEVDAWLNSRALW